MQTRPSLSLLTATVVTFVSGTTWASAKARRPSPAASAPAPAAPSQSQGSPPGPPPSDDGAAPPAAPPVVVLRSNNPSARLQKLQFKWMDVCTAPCGAAVDPKGLFRIGGGTINPSAPFKLPRPSGEVVIETRADRSQVKRYVGLGLSLLGFGVGAAGGFVWASSSSAGSDSSHHDFEEAERGILRGMGVGMAVTGVVLLAVGLPIYLGNGASTVQFR